MISSHEVIKLIEGFSLAERLRIVEEVLKNIREEKLNVTPSEVAKPSLLSLAGIMDDEEAKVCYEAVEGSRKVDAYKN
ncbi:MAG: hypothetical protein SFV55_04520 [Haliscomenobacter sp.]|uniref:hypothetical protein n=1 Tax=Haliscomenobacter sp. TaxID=2717303 RepID=UPI0029B4C8BD|nr:hypothetical protein [Haliscomenobacter sp.]MDX2067666.1 hypothetical protein [Haliscomenobacter sp.]